jgi:DNA-binding Xre family transcriptional regulator
MRLKLIEAYNAARDEGQVKWKYELAASLGLTKTQLKNIMEGRTKMVSIDLVATICHRLGCTPNDLWGWSSSES